MMLVLFNNDAQGAITLLAVKVNDDADALKIPVKISAGSAAKVLLALSESEKCSDANPSFEYKLAFAYKTQDGTSYTQEGPAPLIGRCSSNEMPADLCHPCPNNEICCEPAACNPYTQEHKCGTCGNGASDEVETCGNCPSDVLCLPGTRCVGNECISCVATGHFGCPEPACCGEGIECDSDGYCIDKEGAEVCGDYACASGETCNTCPQDCGGCEVVCGNGICQEGESCPSCSDDCACPECGDGECNGAETCGTCQDDCGECLRCANGICESLNGEDSASCGPDCYCGNGHCEPEEDSSSCQADCGACLYAPDICANSPRQCCTGSYCSGQGACAACAGPEGTCYDVGDPRCCQSQNPGMDCHGGQTPNRMICCVYDYGEPFGSCDERIQYGCCGTFYDSFGVPHAVVECIEDRCCVPNGTPVGSAGGSSSMCCSGIAEYIHEDLVWIYRCIGRSMNSQCDFNSQCASGLVCTCSADTCPPGISVCASP